MQLHVQFLFFDYSTTNMGPLGLKKSLILFSLFFSPSFSRFLVVFFIGGSNILTLSRFGENRI